MPRISPGLSANETSVSVSADLQAADLERRRRVRRDLDPLARGRRVRPTGRPGDLRAEHELDDLLLAALLRDERPDVLAVAQHRRAVAVRDHLTQAVRDEERRAAALLLPAHHVEDALREVGRKGGGDLVEDQQLRLARERARQVDHPQERQRHVERLLPEVDLEIELVQVPADRVDRRAGQAEVLRDRQVGHERGILEDGREPDARRLRRRRDPRGLAVHLDRAGVLPDHPGQHLDERALAGAVRAQERVHLTRLDDERRRPQRHHRSVALRYLACGEEAHRYEEGRATAALPSFDPSATAPCSR